MPLNEREQKILEEIERQFRAEDPDLVRAASTMPPLKRFAARNRRLMLVGAIAGLIVTLATFSFNTFVALGGFLLMVACSTGYVQAIRGTRAGQPEGSGDDGSVGFAGNRWPFRR